MRRSLGTLAAALVLLTANPGQLDAQRPTPTPPIFDPRPLGVIRSPTPTPARKARRVEEEERPIPRGWKIAAGIGSAVAAAGLLYGAARAWRSSNLFDRQYVFPVHRDDAAIRFGGEKSGGHMATVRFRPERAPLAGSEPKDA